MGLFSIFSKNKQDSTAQDSGRFSRDDDYAQQARAKRASHANEAGQGGSRRSRSGGDPMLPEKKRARRRLVGAIALALAAAVGLPMLLDSEPRPPVGDIAIQIPAKDKVPPLPMPATPQPSVPAADSVDQDEEIIAAPPVAPARPAPVPTPPVRQAETPKPDSSRDLVLLEPPKPPKSEPKPEPKPEPKKPAEHKPEPKPERKPAEKPVEKAVKPEPKKAEDKPAARPKDDEAARALALLEGKPAPKPAAKPEAPQRFVVQAAALASQDKVDELQARLRAAGVSSYTQKSGTLIRVRIGPFGSREEAEKAKAKLGGLGLSPTVVPG